MRNWDARFMEVARLIATWSQDPSSQIGAVIVGTDKTILATGFNGFPRGCDDSPSIYEDRPRKHLRVVHAESNAISASSRTGASLLGSTAYVTAPCCSQCAALLIQAGVSRVVIPASVELRPDWKPSVDEGMTMFSEAGVLLDSI